MFMKNTTLDKILIFVIIILLFTVSLKFSNITGLAVVEQGKTGDAGKQEKGNPNYGTLKGTIVLVIKDNDKIISSEDASNQVISFVEKGKSVSDWTLIKESQGNYKGELKDVDADGDENKCSSQDYETKRMYYDTDNNGNKGNDEFYVYQVTSNDKGCFVAKLPPADYDIYL
jgi:hypothetical protein